MRCRIRWFADVGSDQLCCMSQGKHVLERKRVRTPAYGGACGELREHGGIGHVHEMPREDGFCRCWSHVQVPMHLVQESA